MKNLTVIMTVALLVLSSVRVHAEGLVQTSQLSLDMARTLEFAE